MTTQPEEQPDDNARVSRLSSPPPSDANVDDTVREYQERYSMGHVDEPAEDMPPVATDRPKAKTSPQQMPSRIYRPRSYSNLRVSEDERLWASIAHASAWITFIGAIFTGGTSLPFSIFIPLAIYFMFRRKSDYVAFHSLQAFVIQLIGIVGSFVVLFAGGLVWGIGMIIALVSMVIVVGFVLVPVWGLVGLVMLLVVVALPIAMVLFSTIAAVNTYNGGDYQIPFISKWVDRQLAGGFLNPA